MEPVLIASLGNSSGSHLLRTISNLLPGYPVPENSPRVPSATKELSISANLSNTVVLESLVDSYFMFYNPSYPILHEKTFRRQYQSRADIDACPRWHLIFHIVLAIGEWILAGGPETEQSRYYIAARSRMSMRMLESGTLLTVQAFLLMVT